MHKGDFIVVLTEDLTSFLLEVRLVLFVVFDSGFLLMLLSIVLLRVTKYFLVIVLDILHQ